MYGETDGTLKKIRVSLTKVALIRSYLRLMAVLYIFIILLVANILFLLEDMKEGFFLNSGAKLDSVE